MYSGRVWLECLICGCRFFTARKFRSPAVLSIVWWCSWYTRPSLATMIQSNRFPATSLSLLLQHHYCIQLTVLRSLVSTAPAAFSATLMPLLLHSHQRSSTLLLTFVKLFCQTSLNHCFPAVKFLQTVLFELPRVFFSQQCLATLFWVFFSFFVEDAHTVFVPLRLRHESNTLFFRLFCQVAMFVLRLSWNTLSISFNYQFSSFSYGRVDCVFCRLFWAYCSQRVASS